jgi:hypothetical protein
MDQLVQLVGAFLILIAYALAQLGVLAPRGTPFLLLNLAGALVLAASAWHEEQWGVPRARGGVGARVGSRPRRQAFGGGDGLAA